MPKKTHEVVDSPTHSVKTTGEQLLGRDSFLVNLLIYWLLTLLHNLYYSTLDKEHVRVLDTGISRLQEQFPQLKIRFEINTDDRYIRSISKGQLQSVIVGIVFISAADQNQESINIEEILLALKNFLNDNRIEYRERSDTPKAVELTAQETGARIYSVIRILEQPSFMISYPEGQPIILSVQTN